MDASFNKAAAPDTFDIDRAVAELYDVWPHLRRMLYVYETSARRAVHPDADGRKEIDDFLAAEKSFEAKIEHTRDKKTSKAATMTEGRSLLLIYAGKEHRRILGPAVPRAQMMQFSLDHEVGHRLVRNGRSSSSVPALAESVADAYAVLRHLQRYGTTRRGLDHLAMRRAGRLFLTGVSENPRGLEQHFTAPVITRLLQDKDKLDIAGLDPQQTVELARAYALEYTMNASRAQRLHDTAKTFRGKAAGVTAPEEKLKMLAQDALSTQQPDFFRWAGFVLQGHLDGKVLDEDTGKPVLLTGAAWDDVRARLKERTAELNARGLLFGIKIKKPESL